MNYILSIQLKPVIKFAIIFSFIFLHLASYGQVIEYSTAIEIDDHNSKTVTKIIRIQINSKEDNWPSHVEILHSPLQKLNLKYAEVTDRHGNTVRKIKKKDLITRNDLSHNTFYQDDLITEFDLYWNVYPYQINYSYSIQEDEFLNAAFWTPSLYSNFNTNNASLTIATPINYKLNIYSPSTNYKTIKNNDQIIYRWNESYKKFNTQEPLSPSPFSNTDFVVAIPSNFKYGVSGSSDSWQEIGKWISKLNEGTDILPSWEKVTTDKIIEGITDRREIVKVLYHYLQDKTKYINISIETGGLKTYPASYVCKNKYGDCKALTTYMKALLKAYNINSYYSIVNAGKEINETITSFPSQQFNHVILMVPLKTDTIWLENTSNSTPFNYLGTFTQNRYVLATDSNSGKLIKTPTLKLDDVFELHKYNYIINDSNKNTTPLDLTIRGEHFEYLKDIIINYADDEIKNYLKSIILINDFKIDDYNIIDYNRDSLNLHINVTGTNPKSYREIGHLKMIYPFKIPTPELSPIYLRKNDVKIDYPTNIKIKSKYLLEDNSMEINLPSEIEIITKYGSYTTSIQQTQNYLEVSESFVLLNGKYPIDEYSKFYNFIESINNYQKQSLITIK